MRLYNSYSRTKEPFIPLRDKNVSLYVCGITPYDTTHLGHAFTYVVFDVLVRYLRFRGYRVTYTQNVTDIDDDILKRARETGEDWRDLGEKWTERFLSDMKTLNVAVPDHYVKATGSIAKIIEISEKLLQKGIAYQAQGNVYFDIHQFDNYGALSHYSEQQMLVIAKERGGNPDDLLKKHPLDFLLWQAAKQGEPQWESPWGPGRPGWHIECSSMIHQYLGDQIDIHGGGRDLIFPHHESEIAQSESYTGQIPFVNYWMHVAMLLYEGEKMSKSLGNLIMVADLLKNYSADAVRYVLLSHHYRTPWEFREEELVEAEKIVQKGKGVRGKGERLEQFIKYMDDDLNTPKALSLIGDPTVRKVLGFSV